MSDKTGKSKADARAERLAAALRANLRRRKDQSRGQRDDGAAKTAPGRNQPTKDGET